MKVPVAGGTPVPVGPPGFGRLNDIHVHKSNTGSPGMFIYFPKRKIYQNIDINVFYLSPI